MRVTAFEFLEGYETFADQARVEPVTITEDGHDRLVLLSAQEYERLCRRDRRAVLPEDLTAEELAAIAAAKVAPEHEHLNQEAQGWRP